MNRIAALVLCLAVASCAAQRPVTEQRDSVIVTQREIMVLRDTTVMWRIPDGYVRSDVFATDTSRLSTSLATSEAWVSGGRIHHTLNNRGGELLPIPIRIPEYRFVRDSDHISQLVRTEYVEREPTWWEKFWTGAGKVLMGVLFATLVLTAVFRKR